MITDTSLNPKDPNDKYEYPFYLWGTGNDANNFTPKINDGYLYHYTKPESLFKILENMTLRLSKVKGLNDVSEGAINWLSYNMESLFGQTAVGSDEMLRRCSLISFTRNFRPSPKCEVEPGTMHARMWAQYAANNTGACICIRKDRFLQENKAVLKDRFYKLRPVTYGFGKPSLEYKNETPDDFVKKYWKEIFFCKENDWKQENEYRLFGVDLPEYLSLENSIAYICFGAKFHDTILKGKKIPKEWKRRKCKDILVDVLNNPSNRCYKRFGTLSFAQMSCPDGYLLEDRDYSFVNLLG